MRRAIKTALHLQLRKPEKTRLGRTPLHIKLDFVGLEVFIVLVDRKGPLCYDRFIVDPDQVSSSLRTLPVGLFGNAFVNSIKLGILKSEIFPRQNSTTSRSEQGAFVTSSALTF